MAYNTFKESLEIERKFILSRKPDLDYDYMIQIFQYYLNENIRFRSEEINYSSGCSQQKYFCCIKENLCDANPCKNIEKNISIDAELFLNVYKYGFFKNIQKTRYIYNYQNQKFEIDVFKDLNLCLCEIELSDENQNIVFPHEIKELIVSEVTHDKNYKNFNLAKI